MSKHYKHPTYGMVFCNEELNSPPGRGCWFSLVSPKDPPPPKPGEQPGKPRFEATLLLGKDDPRVDPFLQELATLFSEMQDIYNEGQPAKLSIESFIKDGDSFDMEKYPYYKNCWVLVARNAAQPETYDVNAENIAPAAFIGGQQIRMRIQPLVTAKGASFKLKVIQLLADDGVRFAGGTKDYKSLMAVLGEETDGSSNNEGVAEAEKPVAQVAAPVVAKTRGRPPMAKPAPATAVVNPASLRAQAAAAKTQAGGASAMHVNMVPKPMPTVQAGAKKGIGLALDKI